MGYYLDLYGAYARHRLKVLAQYRADFGIMIASTTIRDGLTLLFLGVIFRQTPALRGWTFDEVLLIYGLGSLAGCLNTTLFELPHAVSWYIQQGRLDTLLVRPPRPLFQLLGETCLNPIAAGGFVVAIGVIVVVLARLGQPFQSWWPTYIALAAISGALLQFSVTLIFACLSFRFTSVSSLLIVLGYLPEYARYPLAIYARPIAFTLTWILPYAMAGVYPAGFLLDKDGYRLYGLIAPLIGWLFLGLALAVWSAAVRGYKSTGT